MTHGAGQAWGVTTRAPIIGRLPRPSSLAPRLIRILSGSAQMPPQCPLTPVRLGPEVTSSPNPNPRGPGLSRAGSNQGLRAQLGYGSHRPLRSCGDRYENKYVKFFKSKPELPPGLSPEATTPVTPSRPEGGEASLSKTAKRNLKRKEKRRQQQEKGEAEALSRTLEKVSLGETVQLPSALQISQAAPTAALDPDLAATTEKAKKIKSLKKKLRQVEELQQRIQAGEVSQPSKEQLEKLARRRALEEELEDLELGL
ncbi:partner of Y14 and mago isoform X2 [Perognathus longimembris pacificus]|uniref:partner of Y14 and mago isoform X2 n=1 Tax=Perognathus longimembris pacificus TaxID=214514 RepID=UPI002019553B|nr:partner of Y14 and mago isoform X2 [Perognathus longimembris pacificus]